MGRPRHTARLHPGGPCHADTSQNATCQCAFLAFSVRSLQVRTLMVKNKFHPSSWSLGRCNRTCTITVPDAHRRQPQGIIPDPPNAYADSSRFVSSEKPDLSSETQAQLTAWLRDKQVSQRLS